MTITFLTMNVRGLNHPAKCRSLWKEATQNNCDILCAQETHFNIHAQPSCSNPKFPHIFFASADTKKRGVLTAVRDTVAFHLNKEISDPRGRYHVLICDINSTTYTVVNVYAPNVHQTRFLHRILKKISQIRQGYLLLCGDFNLPPDPKMDSTTSSNRQHQALQPLLL